MSDTPNPDEPEPGWLYNVRVFYPYLSALAFGPICIVLGWCWLVHWFWLALGFAVLAIGVVILGFDLRRTAGQMLLLWNGTEMVVAFYFIALHLREWLQTLRDAQP